MNYTFTQLVRVSPRRHRWHLWRARLSRLWRSSLRLAPALATVIGALLLTIQYFIRLPPFAFFGKRAERRETRGWSPVDAKRNDSLNRQY